MSRSIAIVDTCDQCGEHFLVQAVSAIVGVEFLNLDAESPMIENYETEDEIYDHICEGCIREIEEDACSSVTEVAIAMYNGISLRHEGGN